ncbi:MAG: non-canonical purine NTP diphosphatase [Paludibacter sp.]|nr:non-canonical purine NTP diphosphatase [Paludibacter sp.]MDD4197942.1 non-canonical purine NTP diphosphatase [Paludibacter sp.]
MRKLVFATNNAHKLDEVKSVSRDSIAILSLKEINCFDDIPETADTLEGNALLKAQYIYNKYGYDCFADDTGLEVDALDGRPGVYSARYAGDEQDAVKNMQKLLSELDGVENRKAQFRTVVALIESGEIRYFEGKITGKIIREPAGKTGFGYDPIFIPDGFSQTFAELGSDLKNKISHRALAINELKKYLNQSI